MKVNALNWFEIYVSDFERSCRFYETVLETALQKIEMEDSRMGLFPFEEASGVGGALTRMEGCEPGPGGTMVYLNVEGDLDGVLKRVPEAGGKVLRERMPIPPHGFIGVIQDPEGNVVGLHSMV